MNKKQAKHLTLNEKKILVNVYKYIEKTMPTYPYKSELYNSTAEIMRVSAKTVHAVVRIFEKNKDVPKPKVI